MQKASGPEEDTSLLWDAWQCRGAHAGDRELVALLGTVQDIEVSPRLGAGPSMQVFEGCIQHTLSKTGHAMGWRHPQMPEYVESPPRVLCLALPLH